MRLVKGEGWSDTSKVKTGHLFIAKASNGKVLHGVLHLAERGHFGSLMIPVLARQNSLGHSLVVHNNFRGIEPPNDMALLYRAIGLEYSREYRDTKGRAYTAESYGHGADAIGVIVSMAINCVTMNSWHDVQDLANSLVTATVVRSISPLNIENN